MFKLKEGISLFGGEGFLTKVTGNYGTVSISGNLGSSGGYAGYSINDGDVFMSNGSVAGLYNDVNNEWYLYGERNGKLRLFNNGVEEARTDGGFFLANNQMRSPIFYDNNDTNYYTNQAGTSNFNTLNVGTINRSPTVTLSGDVTGSATMTNLGSINIVTAVANDSHTHSNYVLKTGDTMTGTLNANGAQGITLGTSSSRSKLSVYNGGPYQIGMQSGVTYGGLNDWAMTFQFNNETDRGFWWGHDGHSTAQGAMSLTTAGHLFVGSRVDAPIFYDSNDTGFFLDPNASGDPATTSLKIRGGIRWHTDELDFSVGVHSGMEPMSLRIWDNYTQTGAPQTYGTVLDIYGRSGHWRHQFHYLGSDLQFRSGGYGSETWSGWQSIFHDGYHPNADKWTTARTNTVTLTGDVTGSGSASVDGSNNWTVSVATTVANDSHEHTRIISSTAAPSNALQYWQASGLNTDYAPSTDWYNTIRGSHGDPMTYYSNTLAMKMTGSGTGTIYTMCRSNGTAGAWNQYWHSNNDGSGSGLDADLLDGQHGSYYAPASHTHGYLPLTGGTMSGNINMANYTISGLNNLTFADPGPGEGIAWSGGNGWNIYESPDNLTTNSAGNLQFTTNSTRNMTLGTGGDLYVRGGVTPQYVDTGSGHVKGNLLGRVAQFTINGDADTFYPIIFSVNDAKSYQKFIIQRDYSWTAPSTWNTATHKGGLTFEFEMRNGGWGGFTNDYTVHYFGESYSRQVGGIAPVNHTMAFCVWLRGGGALYEVKSPENFAVTVYDDTSASNYVAGSGWLTYDNTNNTYDVYTDYITLANSHANVQATIQSKMVVRANGTLPYITSAGSSYTNWSSANDGSGSGLDADLLDGYDSSAFASAGHTHSYLPSNTSFDYTEGKQASFRSANTIESASGDQASLEVYQDNSGEDAFMQFHVSSDFAFYFGLDGSTNDLSYGGWSLGANKYKVWTARNDGSGSGLDADLLDGVHGSSFLRSDANDSFTGNLAATGGNHINLLSGTGYGYDNYIYGNASDNYVRVEGVGSNGLRVSTGSSGSGILLADGSVRSPIFYDSDNTAYYLNAAGTSRFNQTDTNYCDIVANAAYGLRFWGGDSGYRIHMSAQGDATNGGRVAGETTSDYNMYFTMSGGTNRGFVFRNTNYSTGAIAGIDASGNGRFAGDVVAYSASDSRLKENIKPITNALEKVRKLGGYEFDWNDKQTVWEEGKHDIGVIAQEVQAVVPEVTKERIDGYLGVDYEKLVPLLIEAIKEQQTQIEELKALVKEK